MARGRLWRPVTPLAQPRQDGVQWFPCPHPDANTAPLVTPELIAFGVFLSILGVVGAQSRSTREAATAWCVLIVGLGFWASGLLT